MAKLSLPASGMMSLLNVLREVDVRTIRASAETPFTMAVVSRDEPMATHIARLMNTGPRDYDVPSPLAVVPMALGEANRSAATDFVVMLTRSGEDNETELKLTRALEAHKIPVLVCLLDPAPPTVETLQKWYPTRPMHLPVSDPIQDIDMMTRIIAGALKLEKLDPVRVARHVPAFRDAVTKQLIADAANTNAAYSVGTGLMEIVPVANVPLNVADSLVLTKNQGIMAYKITLAFGMSADIQHIAPQIAGVIGGGFVLRTVARGLIGLVPAIGIVPKVAIAYAGTVAMGETVQRWCASGERMSAEAMQRVYERALEQGRALAGRLRRNLGGNLRGRLARRSRAPTITPEREVVDDTHA